VYAIVDPDNVLLLDSVFPLRQGDILIRGVKGGFYPCRPDIFAATYEETLDQPEWEI
jgi:hypothetical protein